MATLELRPLQESAFSKVSEAWRAGHKNVMLYAPCGWGKSVFAVAALKNVKERGKRANMLLDRISLVDQMSEQLDKYGLEHGVTQSQHWRYRPSEAIQVCSVQTLLRRQWPESSLNIVDEAHVLMQSVRDKLDERQGYALGLSASPVTPGLGNHFDIVINAATTNQLIGLGLLVPLTIYECEQPDMAGVPIIAGEWKESESEKRSLSVIGSVVEDYLAYGNDAKFIGFGVNIRHVKELQRQFIAAGVNVSTYTADDDDEDKTQIMEEFRKPNSLIRGLLSVDALTRGVDVPDLELLIMARPLRKAWHIVIQMLGRIMRTADGKTSARVHCHSGNIRRFWTEIENIFENGVTELDGHEKAGPSENETMPKEAKVEAEPTKCPSCKHLHKPLPSCPQCGYAYPEKSSGVQHVPGTLKEAKMLGASGFMQANYWPQVVDYVLKVRKKTGDEAQKTAQAIYRSLTGDFAKARVETTTPIDCTAEVKGLIINQTIRYAKGRSKAKK